MGLEAIDRGSQSAEVIHVDAAGLWCLGDEIHALLPPPQPLQVRMQGVCGRLNTGAAVYLPLGLRVVNR